MINIMISQPITGKTDDEIQEVKQDLIDKTYEYFSLNGHDKSDINIIDSTIKDNESKSDLECFVESIQYLTQADYLVVAKKWYKSRGCRLEHEIAKAYELRVLYDNIDFRNLKDYKFAKLK
jgi:hypothetical protein